MVFNIRTSLETVESHLRASGWFSDVMVGEPMSPPVGRGIVAAIFMDSVSIPELTLSGTIESHVVTVRLYQEMQEKPTKERENELDQAEADMLEDIYGDFTLGSAVRAVDVGGQYASPGSERGYIDLGGVEFRIADFTLPLIVDDSATPSP